MEAETSSNLSIGSVLCLVFAPTSLLTLTYVLVGHLVQDAIPSLLLFFLLAVFMLFPVQLFVVLSAGKREYGRYTLKSAFIYHEKLSWWKIVVYGSLLWGFAGLMTATIAPLENRLLAPVAERLAHILPPYFDWNNLGHLQRYPRGILLLTCVAYFMLNGFVGPITEELFFRGYLTAKIDRFGGSAPFIMTVLFSLYHFWLPFSNLFRIIIFYAAAYVAWKKKNIYIAIVFHVLSNLVSAVGFIAAVCAIL